MSITLTPRPTNRVARVMAVVWAIPVALLLAGALGVILDAVFRGSSDHSTFAWVALPVASATGLLLGPKVVRGDRWTAGAAAFAAAVLGTLAGSVVVAASLTMTQAHGVGEALAFSIGGGLAFLVFAGVPALLAAFPATLVWAALVRASAGRWDRYVGSTRTLPQR